MVCTPGKWNLIKQFPFAHSVLFRDDSAIYLEAGDESLCVVQHM